MRKGKYGNMLIDDIQHELDRLHTDYDAVALNVLEPVKLSAHPKRAVLGDEPDAFADTVEPPQLAGVFADLMVERMAEKQLQYGPLEERFPSKVHAIDTAIKRLDAYITTGNTAHLVDAANFIAIEFEHPSHPIAHLKPLGPDDSPGQVLRNGD